MVTIWLNTIRFRILISVFLPDILVLAGTSHNGILVTACHVWKSPSFLPTWQQRQLSNTCTKGRWQNGMDLRCTLSAVYTDQQCNNWFMYPPFRNVLHSPIHCIPSSSTVTTAGIYWCTHKHPPPRKKLHWGWPQVLPPDHFNTKTDFISTCTAWSISSIKSKATVSALVQFFTCNVICIFKWQIPAIYTKCIFSPTVLWI